jgi:hypothetical protein
MRHAMPAHILLLVRFDSEVTSRPGGAQQHKPRFGVFGEIPQRGGLVNLSLEEATGTRHTPSLQA